MDGRIVNYNINRFGGAEGKGVLLRYYCVTAVTMLQSEQNYRFQNVRETQLLSFCAERFFSAARQKYILRILYCEMIQAKISHLSVSCKFRAYNWKEKSVLSGVAKKQHFLLFNNLEILFSRFII